MRSREDEERARVVAMVKRRSRAAKDLTARTRGTQRKGGSRRHQTSGKLQQHGEFARLKAEETAAFEKMQRQAEDDRAAQKAQLEKRLKRASTFRQSRRSVRKPGGGVGRTNSSASDGHFAGLDLTPVVEEG